MWSDESLLELFSTLNRENDRVSAGNSDEVDPCVKAKFPAKVHVGE